MNFDLGKALTSVSVLQWAIYFFKSALGFLAAFLLMGAVVLVLCVVLVLVLLLLGV